MVAKKEAAVPVAVAAKRRGGQDAAAVDSEVVGKQASWVLEGDGLLVEMSEVRF